MPRLLTFILTATLGLILLNSCLHSETINGNGQIESQGRKVSPFASLDLRGAYRLHFEQAEQQEVSITTDSNVEAYIITRVRDGELAIFNKRGYNLNTRELPLVTIKGPRLTAVTLEGSGILRVHKLKQTVFQLTIKGAGSATLAGEVSDFTLTSNGASKVDAHALKAKNVTISMDGAGNAVVNATGNLALQISGSGYIEYYGSPQSITQTIQGSGRIFEVPSHGKNTNQNP